MDTTRVSLILRLRDLQNATAWGEFDALYGPLVYRYARAKGLSRDDAEEVRSQIMTAVVKQIGSFEYDRAKGGFKNWLRRLVHNKTVDLIRRRRERQAESSEFRALSDNEPGPDEVWETTWLQTHLRYCVEQLRGSVSEQTYRAFHMLVFEEREVDFVCRELDMNPNQVYKAKSRLLAMIREKMTELGVE